MRHTLLVCSLLLAVLFISSSIQVSSKEDPELLTCQHQCRVQQQADESEIDECLQSCDKYTQEKQRHGGRGQRGRHEGGGGYQEKGYKMCHEQCQRESEDQESRRKCLTKCERRQGRGRGDANYDEQREWEREREEEYEEEGEYERHEGNNPYVFKDEHFSSRFQTQHGSLRVLQRFADRSELLRGIDNYRLAILEAQPQTFIIPNHFDAEAVFFVVKGQGALSLIRADTEKRESFNIKKGDVLKIPAGTPLYLINRDNNEKLIIARLFQSVFTPGHFEDFFGVGGENPESFYTTFSTEILEAAFNAKRQDLERIFGGEQKEEGMIIKASQEQVKALSQHEEGGVWPFRGGESKGTTNIFKQRPSSSNQYGQLYEVSADDLRGLEDLDIQVSFLNLTENAMVGPMYTSKATKISLVVDGEGYFEMACPHLSSQSQRGRRGQSQRGSQRGGRSSQSQRRGETSYEKVNTRLTRGTVVVIPAGHPYVAVASDGQNLQMVCFEVNARNSFKYLLAGKGNVVNQFEKEAKELAFGVSSQEVDQVFGSQQEEFFFPGPQHQQQHRGRAYE
ncbi:hypothetical protein Leryth_003957 [Lithospermum erythrorhizon]|nr:hypothetical protein Leryth_003957 [Lithospermum erythrorhizon]